MPDEQFSPDKGRTVERLHAAELALEAKIQRVQFRDAAILNDKQRNIDRIVGSMGSAGIGGTAPSCKRCGDPYAALKDGLCPPCQRERRFDHLIDKMSPEEMHDTETDREEQE